MLFDYETLRVIWWLLLGVLLIGFAIMDGFDVGVAVLLLVMTEGGAGRAAGAGSSCAAARSSSPGRRFTPPASPASTSRCS